MTTMISLTEALALYPQSVPPLPAEPCALNDALGRVLAEPVASATDLPLFTQSAVDGYALHSADLAAASKTKPVALMLAGEVAAGGPAGKPLKKGTAVRILTGGALPKGADTVARQEIAERDGQVIRLRAPVEKGADTRYRGEELKKDDLIAQPGQRLRAGLLAALAMAGVERVSVHPRPRVAVLVTGDEIEAAGAKLAEGQVYDANGPLVRSWFVERGYPAPDVDYVPDRPAAVERALSKALGSADLVLSTGGVSVGDRDYLPEFAEKLGVKKVFWKVAQKPGKPLWFGMKEGRAFLGMPGNPAAVLVCLAVHVTAVLARLEGEAEAQPTWRTGILETEAKADPRDCLVRVQVRYDEQGCAVLAPLPKQQSHMLSNLAQADGLAWISASGKDTPAGTVVRWTAL